MDVTGLLSYNCLLIYNNKRENDRSPITLLDRIPRRKQRLSKKFFGSSTSGRSQSHQHDVTGVKSKTPRPLTDDLRKLFTWFRNFQSWSQRDPQRIEGEGKKGLHKRKFYRLFGSSGCINHSSSSLLRPLLVLRLSHDLFSSRVTVNVPGKSNTQSGNDELNSVSCISKSQLGWIGVSPSTTLVTFSY